MLGAILHATPAEAASPVLLGAIAGAALGAAVLVGLGVGALLQRRSRPYLLLVGALLALLGQSVVGGATMTGLWTLSGAEHHAIEHGLDAALVALVIAAVYHARHHSREVGGA
jgi:hypothetical protein